MTKKILLMFLLINSIKMNCQKEYDFKGFKIKSGRLIFENDSILEYQIYNCIFIPKKKISLNKTKRILNKDIKYLNSYGQLYNILPNKYDKNILKSMYDTLDIKKNFKNHHRNTSYLILKPINITSFNLVNSIKFDGIFKDFKQEELECFFTEYKNNMLPEEITIDKSYFNSSNNKLTEKRIKKKRFLFYKLVSEDNIDSYKTIMIYNFKLDKSSKEM